MSLRTKIDPPNNLRLLVVDDERGARELLRDYLTEQGYSVDTAEDGRQALERIGRLAPDLVITDLRMPGMDGIELVSFIREHSPETDVIIITAYADKESAIKALKADVYDYLTKPLVLEELGASVKRVAEKHLLNRRNIALRRKLVEGHSFDRIIGVSPQMQSIYDTIKRLSESECNVLIYGESGTGKELVARAIHESSPRFDGPFIIVDCGALNENLLESELYGHVKGAFTGALYDKVGIFEKAHRGTVFLDEIGVTSPSFQTRLLRVIEEGEFRKVGSTKVTKVDIRIISATNEDLERKVKEGTFREDLYYRLNVARIDLPPLRDRRSDIPLLVRFFLDRSQDIPGPGSMEISREAMAMLMAYDWPGNVRELENVIKRAAVFSNKVTLLPEDLPEKIRNPSIQLPLPGKHSLKEIEKNHILRVLESTGGHRARAAKILGISERTLYRKLRQHRIHK